MNRDDWFKEEPSQTHRDKVMRAANSELDRIELENRKTAFGSKRRWAVGTFAAAVASAAVAFVLRLTVGLRDETPRSTNGERKADFAFQGLDSDALDVADIQMNDTPAAIAVSDLSNEIDVLENLEFLEVLELLEKQEMEKWEA